MTVPSNHLVVCCGVDAQKLLEASHNLAAHCLVANVIARRAPFSIFKQVERQRRQIILRAIQSKRYARVCAILHVEQITACMSSSMNSAAAAARRRSSAPPASLESASPYSRSSGRPSRRFICRALRMVFNSAIKRRVHLALGCHTLAKRHFANACVVV